MCILLVVRMHFDVCGLVVCVLCLWCCFDCVCLFNFYFFFISREREGSREIKNVEILSLVNIQVACQKCFCCQLFLDCLSVVSVLVWVLSVPDSGEGVCVWVWMLCNASDLSDNTLLKSRPMKTLPPRRWSVVLALNNS